MGNVLTVTAEQFPGVVAGAVLTALLAYFGRRANAHSQRMAIAASGLVAPISELERLVRAWRYREVSACEVRETLVVWDRAWRSAEGMLPGGWRHLNRDVRHAIGNSLGGAAALAADSGLDGDWRPDQFEYHWWDISLTYFEYIRIRLQRLALAGRPSAKQRPSYYHDWRRSEDAAVHVAAREAG